MQYVSLISLRLLFLADPLRWALLGFWTIGYYIVFSLPAKAYTFVGWWR